MTQEIWDKMMRVHHPPALIRSEESDGRRKEIKKVLTRYIPHDWDRSKSLLAPGCGDGYEIDILRGMGFSDSWGLTNDPRESAADPRIVLDDMHDMPRIGDKSIQYMYSKETLEHTPAPYVALCEFNRVMAPGGQFLHLISISMEKQRELYHFSCFPDWVWVDLFLKTGFIVDRLYVHPIQIGILGHKAEDKDFDKVPDHWSYDLNGVMNGLPKENLEL